MILTITTKVKIMSNKNQQPGGSARPLENNFSDGKGWSRSKSNAPKISGAGGGNATGPELSNKKGQQSNG